MKIPSSGGKCTIASELHERQAFPGYLAASKEVRAFVYTKRPFAGAKAVLTYAPLANVQTQMSLRSHGRDHQKRTKNQT